MGLFSRFMVAMREILLRQAYARGIPFLRLRLFAESGIK